jgi:hypothetical protein
MRKAIRPSAGWLLKGKEGSTATTTKEKPTSPKFDLMYRGRGVAGKQRNFSGCDYISRSKFLGE